MSSSSRQEKGETDDAKRDEREVQGHKYLWPWSGAEGEVTQWWSTCTTEVRPRSGREREERTRMEFCEQHLKSVLLISRHSIVPLCSLPLLLVQEYQELLLVHCIQYSPFPESGSLQGRGRQGPQSTH